MSLDNVRTGAEFDLISLYQDNDEHDSPFQYNNNPCNYYEPYEFRRMIDLNISDSISYFHLNCRGLSSNWDSFHDLLCTLNSDKFSFDFIGISEVFKTDGDSRIRLPGYHPLVSCCREDGPRGGVGLFIKENINFHIRNDINVFLPHIFESIFLEVRNGTGKNTVIGVIYRPNTEPYADMDIFENTLCEIMNIIQKEHKHCIVMGDMNIDLLKFETYKKTDNYLDNIFSNGFLPVIVKPTRITPSSATLIDHIYTNTITDTGQSGIIITDVADHFGIYHIIKNKITCTIRQNNKTQQIRYFSDRNVDKFKISLQQIDFTCILEIVCPEEAYNKFMEKYMAAFKTNFPLREHNPKSKYIKREPWYTTGLLTSSKQKSKLLTKKLCKPTEANVKEFKEYNNMYNKLKRKMKATYYKIKLDENRQNIKKTWSILKQALGKCNDKSNYPNILKINNDTVTDI